MVAAAIGAHGLHSYPESARQMFQSAAHYQMLHDLAAIATLALAEAIRPTNPKAAKWMDIAAWLFAVGTTFFSFTIYATTLGAPQALAPLTPSGGLMMMTGWCLVMVAAFFLYHTGAPE
ncbi:hypothetical protein ABB37_01656 [Leptomonas pyrrhocoris]|uniref:DUF423 domain-containing protein n=1 Tax=Leptomonas pyrrhocoris TaxID=157538 RepID=A0A0M9G9E4_LEPPY|nr:hypothetical protein ABB37_01656 [Leptomonas pyrrhocoris]XP_015663764.1 hypothetical protein ABB37_01656 [Leptomonas pyrrhocoris]XP_015663765.1 hypothetical protein ABB37_01656 [Leptomonas pyrrhocoris]XP_015663766.1 hypothetical protein ABB37_01656 [Leptomonas pyrrhocoris]KPA85324.1 hypothetical protein ABB37_01656 [Leptomonas pyrrhocoris]KPA85325.1 hypothetical protein ABB37_01656 [Leptomonas pyrrhocoris]KPA85326.1 hypothetical protein ABB37_01656 [Leptomonas pyrrhocoris]KPA85327.1 hypot|eukprot:XP_015663763.1 hypothetical protein ABB37_01656 [Leptomonas pyrrhocoris]